MSQTRVGDGDLMLPAYCALICQSLDPRQAQALVPACDVVTGQLVRLTAGNEPRRFTINSHYRHARIWKYAEDNRKRVSNSERCWFDPDRGTISIRFR